MYRACASIFKTAHHIHDVECFAIARVAVNQNRQPRRARHLADVESHIFNGENAKIRTKELASILTMACSGMCCEMVQEIDIVLKMLMQQRRCT